MPSTIDDPTLPLAPSQPASPNSDNDSTSLNIDILNEIGRGGMGVVYRVRDRKLGRFAALKVLVAGNANKEAEERFLREARITANLDHPSIPAVFDAGRNEKMEPFLLMRLIEGETLSKYIQEQQAGRQKKPRVLLETLIKVGEAISHAHDRGVLHRDLKPANIMIGQFGEVLVMDWGLAGFQSEASESLETIRLQKGQALDARLPTNISGSESELTMAGSVMGTPGYMSPEQANGEIVDERTDVFALGAVLTFILTGSTPVRGESAIQKIKKTLDGDFDFPRDLDHTVPAELDWIARQALAADKNERTPSARDFVKQIKCYLASENVPGYQYSFREKTEGWLKRHPFTLLMTSAVTVIFFISAVLGLSWKAEYQARTRAEEEVNRRKAVLKGFTNARSLLRRNRDKKSIRDTVLEALGDTEKQSLSEQLTAAEILTKAGLYNDAKEILNQSVSRYPPAIKALYALHFLELKQSGRSGSSFTQTNALTLLVVASQQSQKVNEYTLFAKAQSLIKGKEYRTALEVLASIEDHTSSLSEVYFQRGQCNVLLWRQTNHHESQRNSKLLYNAIAEFTRTLKLDPRFQDAHLHRGITYWRQRRYVEAQTDLDIALSINDKSLKAYYYRGLVKWRRGDFKGAVNDQSKAIALDPGNPHLYYARGFAKLDRNEFRAAQEDFKTTLLVAKTYFSQHQEESNRLQSNWSLKDVQANALCQRARTQRALGNNIAWEADLKKAEDIQQSAEVLYAHARYYLMLDNIPMVFKKCSEALKEDPYHKETLRLRGERYLVKGMIPEALTDFKQLMAIEPENPQAHYYIGLANVHLGQFDKAMAAYDTSIRIDPNNPLRYYSRAYGVAIAGWAAVPKDISQFNDSRSLNNFKEGFSRGPKKDNDSFVVNYVFHPLTGSETHIMARDHGYSFWQATAFDAFCSVFWEYGPENFFEHPSTTDLLVTAPVGAILGELRYQAKERLKKSPGTGAKVMRAILDPFEAYYVDDSEEAVKSSILLNSNVLGINFIKRF